MVPRAALEQEAAQGRISDLTVASVRRAWRRMQGRRWSTTWRDDVGPRVAEVLTAAQTASAARSDAYAAAVLAELDIPTNTTTSLISDVFAGVAGDGRTIESLTYGAVVTSIQKQYDEDLRSLEVEVREQIALEAGETALADYTAAILADTARAAETASLGQRPWVSGYIRMIEPGACSRCVVLAGRFYRWNADFNRHPRCRCVQIPAAENDANDPRTNPNLYFDSLSTAEQDKTFTKAGAEAVRLGADPSQVVNARRGMSTAQQNPRGWIAKGRMTPVDVFGRPTYITTEGVTKRGTARAAMGAGRPVRLMPESIMTLASTPEDRVRLLRLYGYVT